MRLLARNTAEIEIAARSKRRHRSKEERRRIVEESLVPGASVAVIARTHGVNANQVFHWRKLRPACARDRGLRNAAHVGRDASRHNPHRTRPRTRPH